MLEILPKSAVEFKFRCGGIQEAACYSGKRFSKPAIMVENSNNF
jgi:hypothetical protein